jgi:hypothetical protein
MRMAVSQCERRLTLYVVLAFALSSVFYALIIASGRVDGGNGGYATGLDWCPAAAALLTCTLLRIDIGTIGCRWRPWRWQVLAYATPLLFCRTWPPCATSSINTAPGVVHARRSRCIHPMIRACAHSASARTTSPTTLVRQALSYSLGGPIRVARCAEIRQGTPTPWRSPPTPRRQKRLRA